MARATTASRNTPAHPDRDDATEVDAAAPEDALGGPAGHLGEQDGGALDGGLPDVDVPALVGALDVRHVDAALACLHAARAAHIGVGRRPGGPGAAAFDDAVNAALFARRQAVQAGIAALDAAPAANRDAGHQGDLRRASREQEALTELIVRFNDWMLDVYLAKYASTASPEHSEDLHGAATEGLMRAIATFDPAKGSFAGWAFKPLRGAVLRAVRDSDHPTLSEFDFQRRPAILAAYEQLAAANDALKVTYRRVAAACDGKVTSAQVARVLNPPQLDSLDAPAARPGNTRFEDLLPDDADPVEDTVLGQLDKTTLLDRWFAALDAREHFVVVRRYGLDGEPAQMLASIGRQLKLTGETVRQIEGKALSKLLLTSR